MPFSDLKPIELTQHNAKTLAKYERLKALLAELDKHELTATTVAAINAEINKVNEASETDQTLGKIIANAQAAMLKTVNQEHKLVPKNHNRNLWMAVGMSAFGLPLGMVYGLALDNMGFLGLGLPIGLAIGLGIGSNLDKKAEANGLQLNWEAKS